eukprot:scaffold217997_cov31-Tisochrysis_lutea.AAC.5
MWHAAQRIAHRTQLLGQLLGQPEARAHFAALLSHHPNQLRLGAANTTAHVVETDAERRAAQLRHCLARRRPQEGAHRLLSSSILRRRHRARRRTRSFYRYYL